MIKKFVSKAKSILRKQGPIKYTKIPAGPSPKRIDEYADIINENQIDRITNVISTNPTKMPVISTRVEQARKIGRIVESRSHKRYTEKIEKAFIQTSLNPNKKNQLQNLGQRKEKALIKAFKLSQVRGLKAAEKTAEKLRLSKESIYSGTRDRPKKFYKNFYKQQQLLEDEARDLGFPPSEYLGADKPVYKTKFADRFINSDTVQRIIPAKGKFKTRTVTLFKVTKKNPLK